MKVIGIRTARWLDRCKDEMNRLNSLPETINRQQMLFGINQGGIYEDIRIRHAQEITELDPANTSGMPDTGSLPRWDCRPIHIGR